jgi:hypothetical protein
MAVLTKPPGIIAAVIVSASAIKAIFISKSSADCTVSVAPSLPGDNNAGKARGELAIIESWSVFR